MAAGSETKISCLRSRRTAIAVATVRQAGSAGGTAMVRRSKYLQASNDKEQLAGQRSQHASNQLRPIGCLLPDSSRAGASCRVCQADASWHAGMPAAAQVLLT